MGGADGECNDGGPGTDLLVNGCAIGSDCDDCGVRIFCVDCPPACTARAIRMFELDRPLEACMQNSWNDGVCDLGCNNLACLHNDCTSQQIISKCIEDQELSGVGYSERPVDHLVGDGVRAEDVLVPANLQLDLSPARLEIRMEINEMVLSQEVYFLLQWQDPRLKESPCRQVLPELLSLSREDAKSDLARNEKAQYTKRYWLPKLEAEAQTPGYYAWVDEQGFALEEEGFWQEGLAPESASDAAEASSRRRAECNSELAERFAKTPGAASKGPASTVLRAERQAERMRDGWRARERRRLSESAVERRRLSEGESTVTDAPCSDCALLAGEIEFEILQGFKYTDFPFDRHTIRIEIVVNGVDLFTCRNRDALAIMGIDETNAEELLLPATGTWLIDGNFEEAVNMTHPVDALTGMAKREHCVIEIKIRRNWIVYFVKQTFTVLLVTAAGLVALLMQPSELLGDRCAQLLVAVLIIITSLQTDLGLGSLSYLIWVDYFNLMQLIVLLLALAQTMIIHRLLHDQQTYLVIIFDRVFRLLIPLLLWPSLCVGMVMFGLGMPVGGGLLIGGGFIITAVYGGVSVNREYFKARKDRAAAILAAKGLDPDADEKTYTSVMHNLFHKFDIDSGGDIDAREMRSLLENLHDEASRGAIAAGMLEVNKYTGADEELDMGAFIDAFEAATIKIKEYTAANAEKALLQRAKTSPNVGASIPAFQIDPAQPPPPSDAPSAVHVQAVVLDPAPTPPSLKKPSSDFVDRFKKSSASRGGDEMEPEENRQRKEKTRRRSEHRPKTDGSSSKMRRSPRDDSPQE